MSNLLGRLSSDIEQLSYLSSAIGTPDLHDRGIVLYPLGRKLFHLDAWKTCIEALQLPPRMDHGMIPHAID